MNAGLELNLNIEIQLQPQLQALLVHDTLAAGFGVDRFWRRRAEGLVRAAVTHGDLTTHGARVGDRAVHGGRVGACAEADEYGNHNVHRGAVRTGGWMLAGNRKREGGMAQIKEGAEPPIFRQVGNEMVGKDRWVA